MRPKRKRRILLASAILVLAIIITLLVRPSSEPSYNGKSLRQWLEEYDQSFSRTSIDASNAVTHIGTNAIPTLLAMAATRDSAVKKFIIAKVPESWPDRLGFGFSYARFRWRSDLLPQLAWRGFQVLGPIASNAAPGLGCILRTSDNYESIDFALQSLGAIGPPARAALPDLVNELKNPMRFQMYEGMLSMRIEVICSVACENGKWPPDSLRILLPALTDALKETNAATFRVLGMLGRIGPDAKSTIPAIQPHLTSTNLDISSRAAFAIKTIDPNAAAKLGIK